jgi:Domain of unknown function (DUF6378)
MTESICQEAERITNGARLDDYEGTDATIVSLWSAYLGQELTVLDYANLMILLKVARTKGKYHRDSYVDMAGYANVGPRLWLQEPVIPNNFTWKKARDSQALDDYEKVLFKVPREWNSLADVPIVVEVTDYDGDTWKHDAGEGWQLWQRGQVSPTYGIHTPDEYAPFTEILGTDG